LSFLHTLKMMGWPHKRNDVIAGDVSVLATLQDKYLAFEVRGRCAYRVCRARCPPHSRSLLLSLLFYPLTFTSRVTLIVWHSAFRARPALTLHVACCRSRLRERTRSQAARRRRWCPRRGRSARRSWR
jgi:hypothetical protein